MTLAKDEALARIEEAITAEDLAPARGVLISYLLLTEWVSSDGETYLVESRPEGQVYWRTLGLIEAARLSLDHSIQHSYDDSVDEDDE